MISYPGRWRIPNGWFVLGILIAAGLGATPPEAGISLSLGDVVEREIAQGETHAYSLDVPAGHFVQVVVEQHGVDVELVLRDADGEELLHRDSLHGTEGQDRLSTITEADGRLTLEIRTGYAEPESHYLLRLVALRPALDTDRALIQAEELSFQAMLASFRGSSLADKDPEQAIQLRERAVELWSQALPLWRVARDDLGETETLGWSADALHALGVVHYRRGDLLDSRDAFLQAVEIRRALDPRDLPALAKTLTNLAVVTSDLGEYQQALTLLEEAQDVWELWGREDSERTTTLNNLGHAYSRLGDSRTARRFYREALRRNQEEGDREREAKTLHNLAWIAHSLEEHDEAQELYRDTLKLAQELKLRELEATIQESRGRLFEELDRWVESEGCFRDALEIRRELRDRRGEMIALHGLTKLQWKRGELQEARKSVNRAGTLLDEMDHPFFLARHEMLLARIESRSGAHNRAIKHAETALNDLETLRAEVVRQDLRTTLMSYGHSFYETAIDLAMSAHAHRPKVGYDALAFTWNERALARSFLESLTRADVDPLADVEPELAEREVTLRREINQLATNDSEPARTAIEAKLLKLHDLRGKMTRSSVMGLMQSAQPLDLESIQRALLDADTLLLEYSLGDDRSFLWVVSQRKLLSFVLPGRDEIEPRVREAHDLLATGGARADSRDWTQVALELTQTLLAPAAKHLRGHRLVVVPDGALHYLPLAALPDPRDLRSPLLARHEVVHEVSASAVTMLRRSTKDRTPPPKTLAIFASPAFDDVDLQPLPASEAEARSLAALVPEGEAWIALGEEARRDRALNGPLDQYRYVHFATHSRVDEEHPELSDIALADGSLHLHDLYTLRLNADLVTLSACETALGRQVKGEGLISLTRGFLHAGAERVLSSLWSVDDRATMELMSRVYEALLRDDERPAAALRRAQLTLMKSEGYGGPSSWAGFVLQGEWE